MPNYYVNIIDTENADYTTVLENAAASSLVLSYKGKDQKDDLNIVGSKFEFTLEVPFNNNTDAAFLHLFTGDEQRHKIELRRESDDLLIWHGYLLPDEYSEPYTNGTFFIDFGATDGLGRLKGKFLNDTFYSQNKSVTNIIAECLKLTGLNMPFYFSPSIENSIQKNYHQIYIDTTIFLDGTKRDDAYKILETLCKDLLFCVYQSLGRWHCEGLNKRNLINYKVKSYDADGGYIEDLIITRQIKDVNSIAFTTPSVTMVPPYGLVRVTHKRVPVSFPETLSNETNDGWAVVTGVIGKVYVTDWIGGFDPKATEPDYAVVFPNNFTNNFIEDVSVKLLKQIYLNKGDKYKLSFKVTVIDTEINQNTNDVTDWTNPINYQITFNGNRLFRNFSGIITERENIRMKNQKSAELSFEFVVPNNGLLDVIFYQPFRNDNAIEAVRLDELTIEKIGFEEEEVFEDVASLDYTIVKENDITFADDASGYSAAFLLEQLHNDAPAVRQYTIPILYTFTQNGQQISVVQLDGANLIAENIDTAFHQTESVNIERVIYNYANGEQMAVIHDFPNLTGNFIVNKPFKLQGAQDRTTWHQWTDSVAEVEAERFGRCHANVLRRMFTVPHPKIDLTIKTPVAFNDIIRFNYIEQSNYFITNMRSWDIDTGKVTISMTKAVYQNDSTINPGDNIPPFVDAGPTIYLQPGETSANLVSVANDPDGFIVSFQWSQVTAVPGVNINNPLNQNTTVTGLTEDFYTFQITVTDNDGATGNDTVNVVRIFDYDVQLSLTNEVYTEIEDDDFNVITNNHRKQFDLIVTPPLQDNLNLSLSGNYRLIVFGNPFALVDADSTFLVEKNLVDLIVDSKSLAGLGIESYDETTPFLFNINNTDDIKIEIECNAAVTVAGQSANARVYFTIEAIDVVDGEANIITTLPLENEVTVTASIA